MFKEVREHVIDLMVMSGLKTDHLAIPSYYVPYVLLDGLAANAPVHCVFEVTYRCNLYCDVCPQVSHRELYLDGRQIRHPLGDALQGELSTKEIQGAVSDLAKGGTKIVQFTGGEVFLRGDQDVSQ
jgi:MoaA/NifB/PqqE/SkfB family radical SAM enzyme